MSLTVIALTAMMLYGVRWGMWFYLLGNWHSMEPHMTAVARPWLTLKTTWSKGYINAELNKSDGAAWDVHVNQAFVEIYGRFDLKLGRIVHIPGFVELLNPLSRLGGEQISPMMSRKGDDGILTRTSSDSGEMSFFIFRSEGRNWKRNLELKLYSGPVTAGLYAEDSATALMLAYYGGAILKLIFSDGAYGQSIYAVAERNFAVSRLTASFKIHMLIDRDGPRPDWLPFKGDVLATEAVLGTIFDHVRAILLISTEDRGYLVFWMLKSRMNRFDVAFGGSTLKIDGHAASNTLFVGLTGSL